MCHIFVCIRVHPALVTFLPAVLDRVERSVLLMASAGLVHHHGAAPTVMEWKQMKGGSSHSAGCLISPISFPVVLRPAG